MSPWAIAFAVGSVASVSWAASPPRAKKTAEKALALLRERVGAKKVPIENPCVEAGAPGQPCRRRGLDRTVAKLDEARAGKRQVRILHLGDSHVASDYITRTIRDALQDRFGAAGRGFVAIDQPLGFGGRFVARAAKGWERDRIVDANRAGRPFGFSGASLESKVKQAAVAFALSSDESRVRVYYQEQPNGGTIRAYVDRREIGILETGVPSPESPVRAFDTEFGAGEGKGERSAKSAAKAVRSRARERELRLVADGPFARLYGLSFETDRPGLYYDSIGPLGADAKVYLELDPASFMQHLKAHAPDLIVLMVGGNDAMKARRGWTGLEQVRIDHEKLLDFLRSTVPTADCLVWAPMDAGEKSGGRVVSKTLLGEVRAMQREVALSRGCGFWDLLESMGGSGSITRWHAAKVMNDDLVHPREKAAELLGMLFVEAWIDVEGAPK